MAAENMRALLDELNTNVLDAAGEVTDLTAIKELMKNEHLLDGYKLQIEEDKVYLQNERETRSLEVNEELKKLEMEVKRLEIEQRREQFILENEQRKEELKLKAKMHEDDMAMRMHENHRAIDTIDTKVKENELKEEELRLEKKRMIIESVIKVGGISLGAVLSVIAIYSNNEGIFPKSLVDMVQTIVTRKS